MQPQSYLMNYSDRRVSESLFFIWYNVSMIYVDVYIEYNTLKLNQTFTYRCYEDVEVGCRVQVPFGHQVLLAYVQRVHTDCELDSIKDVISVIDKKPLLNEELDHLADWMSSFYVASKISCLKTMLPPALKPSSAKKKIVYEDWIEYLNQSAKTKKQEEFIQSFSFPCRASELRKKSASMTKSLLDQGVLRLFKKEKQTTIVQDTAFIAEPVLTQDQKRAIDEIQMSKDSIYLLHGVTGSGKTEVFLQLADKVLKEGKQVLFLVPEIGLTPMMIQRVTSRFQEHVAIYHSKLNAQEKYNQYCLVRDHKVNIVIGTRSAVFMPFSNIGLILMDEEHDSSYKQDNNPRYHTRDIVLQRSKNHHCKVVLASATPSLDSYARAFKKKYHLVELKNRVHVSMPAIRLIDMKNESVQFGLSQSLIQAIQLRLERKEQVILLLNRRGYLPILRCMDCNHIISCPDCGLALSYHKKENRLVCHCCGNSYSYQEECPNCHGHSFYNSSMGTEKLEEHLHTLFPNQVIVRMDADSTRKKNAHQKLLKEFEEKGDILLGTQMVAKGLDFSRVNLVGILNADSSFARLDFSSNEIAYDLLEQASGRSGRNNKQGEVYIQSFDPSQFVLQCICRHSYLSFFNQEMQFRHLGDYPPYSFLCTLIYMHADQEKLMSIALKEKSFLSPLKTLGPVMISMRQAKKRVRLVVKAKNQEVLNKKIWDLVRYHQSLKTNVSLDINMYPLALED